MSIFKDTRKKDKSGLKPYRVVVYYTDEQGKKKPIERHTYGLNEAKELEQQLEKQYNGENGATAKHGEMTVNDLIEKYKKYHEIRTRATSHDATMRALRLRVQPYVGDCRLNELTQQKLSEWQIKLNGEKLSLVTKQNAYSAFTAMLNYAVKMEFIPKNNLTLLGNFKDTELVDIPHQRLRYYTAEQFQKYITLMKDDCKTVEDWGYFVFFSIAFYTGARKGEIHALKWSDIDGNILHIRRSINQKLKGDDVETAPKNKSSIRDLQLPEPLMKILTEHKERQRNAAPLQFSEEFRVCGGERPLRDTSIDKHNRKYADKAELPHITIHEFRHSHVSVLANEGINIQEIARRLGHSNVQETWNTYSHLYPREEERAVEILNEITI